MKICYVVYREDNVMVFDSQVLEYLQKLNGFPEVEDIELVLFRHQENLRKKEKIESKIKRYVDNYKTLSSLAPPLSMFQLEVDAIRLRAYVINRYQREEKIAVICRGDFATYIASKAFKGFPNSRVLFDNRGLPVEESLMSHPKGIAHKINRYIKDKSIRYSKSHCDMYNFVTHSMRSYDIEKYGYSKILPYTIIPTLYRSVDINYEELKLIEQREGYTNNQYVVTYIGSVEAWQSTEQLVQLLYKLDSIDKKIRYFILTNGSMPGLSQLPEDLKHRIVVKSIPHKEMKYYLHMANVGIVIRDNNIVNKVAAPTKIAEYLTSGIRILYSGDIGILADLKEIASEEQIIQIDSSDAWIDVILKDIQNPKRLIDERIINYFDMESRQKDTINMINKSFNNKKVR